MNISQYWNTIRYLKPIQIYSRILKKIRKFKPDLSSAPNIRKTSSQWINFNLNKPSMVSETRFDFLNQTYDIKEIGWDSKETDKLWLYNLHYFDDLNAQNAFERRDWHNNILDLWIKNNLPGTGTGWEPYPTSLRIVNWVKRHLSGFYLSEVCIHSLAVQTRWLYQNIEWHILGNHLFVNAKALIFSGLFFEGAEADIWLKKGLDILNKEIDEQILNDGGHFERSPMYHALILVDFLDLHNLLKTYTNHSPETAPITQKIEQKIKPMLSYLNTMTHPDNLISFFNDAALDIAPNLNKIEEYAKRLGIKFSSVYKNGIIHAKDTGYIKYTNPIYVAILDTAPIGPDYLPGHGHADTLSFEMSIFDQRVFVNSGTSCYGQSIERIRQRGTAAHNTVIIDDKNSTDVWAGFRVASRAYPFDLKISEDTKCTLISCSHNGYKNQIHNRTWEFRENNIAIKDKIMGIHKLAIAHYYLHPDIKLEVNDNLKEGTIILKDGKKINWSVIQGELTIKPSTFHPKFGISIPNYCLVLTLVDGLSNINLTWDI